MNELKGIEYLRNKLRSKESRVKLRYKYYEMKDIHPEWSSIIPHELRNQYRSTLGWCSKAVDSMADRLVFRGFKDDFFDLEGIYNMNNPDTLFDSAILSALIGSCSFIYILEGDDGFPQMQVIDAGNATGIIDPITGLLYEGYAVLKRGKGGKILQDAYFEPKKTTVFTEGIAEEYTHNVDYPLLAPIINRPDAVRPFGHSRITRACMYYQKYAKRTLERSEVSAEFYAFPQKYVLGLDEDAEPMEKWKATISSFLQFGKGEDGDAPKVGQFSQQSMAPYTDALRTAASGFAAETGLTLDDLGFATSNPSSADAIKAGHESLRLEARKAQRTFGSGFLNAGFLAACLRDDFQYQRSQLYMTKPIWEPLFEPDASQLSGIGDAIIKINQAVPGFFDAEAIRTITGFDAGDSSDAVIITEE